jgi:hypothetical protein
MDLIDIVLSKEGQHKKGAHPDSIHRKLKNREKSSTLTEVVIRTL